MSEQKRPKPDELKAGQWWAAVTKIHGHVAYGQPQRVQQAWGWSWADFGRGQEALGKSFRQSLAYLGDGERPDPSPWMVETLAAHAWSLRDADRLSSCPWAGARAEEKELALESVRAIVAGPRGGEVVVSRGVHAAVVDMHDVLLKLGYA